MVTKWKMNTCLWVSVVCVCVREKEKERQGEKRERETEAHYGYALWDGPTPGNYMLDLTCTIMWIPKTTLGLRKGT